MRPLTAQGIQRALDRGDIAAAAVIAERALAAGEAAPILSNLAAWRREEAGDLAGAQRLLAEALGRAPDDPLLLTGLGAVLRKQHRLEEALELLDRAARHLSGNPAAWLERGYALAELGDARAASNSFARAATADPACAPAHAGQAVLAARAGEPAEVEAHAGRALRLDPANVAAQLALAQSAIERGGAGDARARLERLLARGDLPALDRIRGLGLLGDALDRLDRVDEAFASYQAANQLYRRHHAPAMAGTRPHRDWIETLRSDFLAAAPERWPAPARGEEAEASPHLFLLGYPRSGTTVVENILAGIPGLVAAEERPLLRRADEMLLLAEGGMARLATLEEETAECLRAAYWAAARREMGHRPGAALLDMDPFKSLRLPVIGRLFPEARVIFMRRDPRDVVWSCFRQNFRFSPANYAHADLHESAAHFDATMRFAEAARAHLPLLVHDLPYHALVRDLDATTRALCAFAGLPWSAELRRFDLTARRRGVTTASAPQLRRGLFDGGGQWRRYARHLAPVLPLLEPWVARLGLS